MDAYDVMCYFELESNPNLFKRAVTLPSGGGGDFFTTLAVEGDAFLDLPLEQMFNEEGIHDGEEIRALTQQFHREVTLARLGAYFHLADCIEPSTDLSAEIAESEIKEMVRALVGRVPE